MPRFYFDKVVNGDATHDDVGFEVASLEEARHQAVRTATEIARDLAHKGQVPEILVKVRVGGASRLLACQCAWGKGRPSAGLCCTQRCISTYKPRGFETLTDTMRELAAALEAEWCSAGLCVPP